MLNLQAREQDGNAEDDIDGLENVDYDSDSEEKVHCCLICTEGMKP
jgi:hypothetical protein